MVYKGIRLGEVPAHVSGFSMSQEPEISDAMIHALDTALLAYLGRQKAVEVRDLVLNMPTVRKARPGRCLRRAGSLWLPARGPVSGVPPLAPSGARTGTGTSRSLNTISIWW